ncbi:hypothetical protein L596_006828 [Steinernema carpocapsae]|uniref:E3 ubiquitin-protein ligase listerin n=1 Tax=Steinernema carpocapsae TaxID=34508 RepID=A0A4U5P8C8_STECR|nr:hypothetical protein L596_006828 [Steinernema carpocapsae]
MSLDGFKDTFKMNMINKLPASSALLERFLPTLDNDDKATQNEFLSCPASPTSLFVKILPCCDKKFGFISAEYLANRIGSEQNLEMKMELVKAFIEYIEDPSTSEVEAYIPKNITSFVSSDLPQESNLFSFVQERSPGREAEKCNIKTCIFLRQFASLIPKFNELSADSRDFVNCGVVTAIDAISSAELEEEDWMYDLIAMFVTRVYNELIMQSRKHAEGSEEWQSICNEWNEFIFPTCNPSIVKYFLSKSGVETGRKVSYLTSEIARTICLLPKELFPELILDQCLDPVLDQLGYPEQLQNILNPALKIISGSASPPDVQLASVHILTSMIPAMFEHENKEYFALEKKGDVRKATFMLPYILKNLLNNRSERNEKSISPGVLVWDALVDYALLLDVESKFLFGRALEAVNHLDGTLKLLLTCIYAKLPDVPRSEAMFTDKPPVENLDFDHYFCNLFYRTISAVPADVRDWALGLNKKHYNIVSTFNKQYISPVLCRKELRNLAEAAAEEKSETLKIKVMPVIRQVSAEYKLEDSSMVLLMTLPEDYPLSLPKVEYERQMLSPEMRKKWLLRLVAFMTHQNGTMWDGLNQWRRSIDDHMNGVEECIICFSTVSADNFQLPKIRCKPCSKKFHGSCLYKWFESRDTPTCPHCRAEFL